VWWDIGFGLVIWFIGLLKLIATSNYSTITNSHILQFTTAHINSFQYAVSSPVVTCNTPNAVNPPASVFHAGSCIYYNSAKQAVPVYSLITRAMYSSQPYGSQIACTNHCLRINLVLLCNILKQQGFFWLHQGWFYQPLAILDCPLTNSAVSRAVKLYDWSLWYKPCDREMFIAPSSSTGRHGVVRRVQLLLVSAAAWHPLSHCLTMDMFTELLPSKWPSLLAS
jgi:hypothetical protein